jgi:uncharacterized protein (TIGR03437 family)
MNSFASIRRNLVIVVLSASAAVAVSLLHNMSQPGSRRPDTPSAALETAKSIESPLPASAPAGPEAEARISERYGQLPIRFEANVGQTDRAVDFISRGSGYSLFLTAGEAVLRLRSGDVAAGDAAGPATARDPAIPDPQTSVLRMELIGANRRPAAAGLDPLGTGSNYFIGSDPRLWRTNVANYARIRYRSVYPGIDLEWHGNQRQLEHDFVVRPGADPRLIRFEFNGASSVKLNERGDLVLEAGGERMELLKPVAWQESTGGRTEVDCNFRVDRDGRIEFDLGLYDRDRTLVIDPILLYSTFIGGDRSETGRGIAVDAEGNAYVVGETSSIDFPVINPIQAQPAGVSSSDVFVLKLNPSGTGLVYATYLGGTNFDIAYAVAAGADGAAYLTGYTSSTDFPVTANALQRTLRGGSDVYVTRIGPSGSALTYSTYLGGSGFELAASIAVNAAGEAYLAGYSDSANLPANGFQTTRSGNSFYKSANRGGDWNAADNGLFSSFIYSIAVDPSNSNIVYAGASNGVYKSTDGGGSWQKSGNFITTTNGIAIDPRTPATVYAATSFGFYKSADGGATWEVKSSGITSAFQYFSVLVDPVTPATVYVGTDRGVFKSLNGGELFASTSNGMGQGGFPPQPPSIRVQHLVVDPANPMIVYAGTNQGMYKTLDGGGMWFSINNGISLFQTILSLAIDPATTSTLYLSISGSSLRGSLYKSIDGGNSWALSSDGMATRVTTADLYPTVSSIAVDPSTPSTVYAGTQTEGLFKSTDRGASWSRSSSGLNNAYVRSLAVAPDNPATVYAGILGGPDGFAAKLNAAGSGLIYLTYLGGYESDYGLGIAIDGAGNSYVTGETASANFPVQSAFQSAKGSFGSDAFVTKINPSGTALVYSTYLGGNSTDFAQKIAVDAAGSAYVTGGTISSDFPRRNPLQAAYAGGQYDAFVSKLNPAGSALEYSTYLGGVDSEIAAGIAVDASGNVCIAGSTLSPNFPVKDAVQSQPRGSTEVFVTKLNANGSMIVFSTFLGGLRPDNATAIALDANGSAYVTGVTDSSDWPVVSPLQQLKGGRDIFVAKLGVEADLALAIAASRNPVMVNNNLSYSISVTNLGLSPATGVAVTDQLPQGATFVSASATKGSCDNNAGTVTCNIGDLAVGANAAVTIVVTPAVAGALANTARVRGNEPDPIQSNNQATAQITVSSQPSIAGRVAGASGQGVSGVTMTLAGGQTATQQTGADGSYQFANLTAGVAFTITPSRDNYSFEPASRSFQNLSADQTADFAATVCGYSIATATQSFAAGGGNGSIAVTATPRCPWTASSSDGWITITTGASGAGDGAVNFTVSPSTLPRSGRITVAGRNFAVYQGVASCATPALRQSVYYLNQSFGDSPPARILASDFNTDGKPDLLALGFLNRGFSDSSRQFTVLAGDGRGAFSPLASIRLSGMVKMFAAGDFNGDRRPDIATSDDAKVEIRLNDGAGGLNPPAQFPIPPLTRFTRDAPVMETGDFNRDGKVDLLLHADDTFDRVANIRIMLNNGSGGLNPPISVTLRDHTTLGIADVDKDGNADVLTYAQTTSGTSTTRQLRVYRGDGAGSFGSPVNTTISAIPVAVALGDFNGDGRTDIAAPMATGAFDSPTAIGMFFGDGIGRFDSQVSFDLPSDARTSFIRARATDLNNDAKIDLLLIGNGRIFFFAGDGTGRFGAPATLLDSNSPASVEAADLDLDGKIDLFFLGGVQGDSNDFARVFFNRCGASPAIYGRITDGSSQLGAIGVTVRLAGPQNFSAQTVTDSGGNYLFATGLTPGASYTVTPEKPFLGFTPASRTISNLSSDQAANFTAARAATVASAASFRSEAIAPESIAAIFGKEMTVETRVANVSPIPTQLGGASVTIRDSSGAERPVRLFFISPGQINVHIPPGLALGQATMTVTQTVPSGSPRVTTAPLKIENVAPGLFSMDASGRGLAAAVVLRVKADGTRSFEPVAQYDAMQQRFVAVPIDLGSPQDRVFLIPFGTGIRFRSALSAVTAKIGGLDSEVSFAGAVAELFGVDQVNLLMSRALAGRGEVDVVITADGKMTNAVRVSVK